MKSAGTATPLLSPREVESLKESLARATVAAAATKLNIALFHAGRADTLADRLVNQREAIAAYVRSCELVGIR